MQPISVATTLIALAAVLVSGTPHAYADPQDDAYLSELSGQDITHYKPDILINAGHLGCA